KALQDHPHIQVRMGIHSGPVNRVKDVNDKTTLAGAGINVAQRVLDCGDAGHILLSGHIAEDLAQYRHWQPHLHDLGECEVKHGLRLHLFNLYKDGLGNPQVPEKLKLKKRNSSFAEAVKDKILTRLSKIAHLKVISRTSTQHYKSAPENLADIAKQIGVAHILEGRVQKSGDVVRVNVQLIKAANDSHLW